MMRDAPVYQEDYYADAPVTERISMTLARIERSDVAPKALGFLIAFTCFALGMKWLIFLFLLVLLAPLGAQLRTHYTPRPALQRARRKVWVYSRPRWAIAVAIVRVR